MMKQKKLIKPSILILLLLSFHVVADNSNEIKKTDAIQSLLKEHSQQLSSDVLKTVNAVLKCADKMELEKKNYITIIDYSLPSTEKRLWVFDLNTKKMLYHTYVSHGINTGLKDSVYFSNTNNSRASSLGVFDVDYSYNGRYGYSVRLTGLEKNFNHNAWSRSIVIHPAWYVTEDFIQKYGRLGRSWGCPAIPYSLAEPILGKIQKQSLLVIYYPDKEWLLKSDFLTCENIALAQKINDSVALPDSAPTETRDAVLFIDKNNNNQRDNTDPILVISADNYRKIFNKTPPLNRMLRRPYKGTEYISLTQNELNALDTNNDNKIDDKDEFGLKVLDFVVAKVKKVTWFWATEFKSVKNSNKSEILLKEKESILNTDTNSTPIISTVRFIRWLGL